MVFYMLAFGLFDDLQSSDIFTTNRFGDIPYLKDKNNCINTKWSLSMSCRECHTVPQTTCAAPLVVTQLLRAAGTQNSRHRRVVGYVR